MPLPRPSRRFVFWTVGTVVTALVSRWLGEAVRDYPARRQRGPSAACDPGAARDEQRLAEMPVWQWVERRLAARALRPFRSQPGFRRLVILNVDPGPGGVAAALRREAPLDATVVATDPVPGMSHLARHRTRRRNARRAVQFAEAWTYRLPFRDATFDLVVASLAMHGWPNPEAALAEIARVLRPDGRYLVVDFRRDVPMALWLLASFVRVALAPRDLGALGEPAASIRASYAPPEAEWLAARAKLPDLHVSSTPAWIMIERKRAAPPA